MTIKTNCADSLAALFNQPPLAGAKPQYFMTGDDNKRDSLIESISVQNGQLTAIYTFHANAAYVTAVLRDKADNVTVLDTKDVSCMKSGSPAPAYLKFLELGGKPGGPKKAV